MSTKRLAVIAASAVLLFSYTNLAYAHDVDDCVLEGTYDCLPAGDFWGCYDFVLEGCAGHAGKHTAADLNKLKAETRPQAARILQRHLATKTN